MTMMSDLTQDLVEEILSRVTKTSLGALRSTCKGWNALSKDRILCNIEPKHQFLGFMVKDFWLCSMRFNLHGILNEDGEESVDQSIKEIGILHDNRRWIKTKNTTDETRYALGCDNNKNHKILRFSQNYNEIYDIKSDSWRVLNIITNRDSLLFSPGTTLNGNTYFWMMKNLVVVKDSDLDEERDFLICFDFTTERFGQLLSLPSQNIDDDCGILSCVKEEKLAVLYQIVDTSTVELEIWITTKIEPNAVSWIPFLVYIIGPSVGLDEILFDEDCSFFIDEANKLAVVFGDNETATSYIIGENGYLKKINLGVGGKRICYPCMCSYSPSLVQIAGRKRGGNNRKSKRKGKKREGGANQQGLTLNQS